MRRTVLLLLALAVPLATLGFRCEREGTLYSLRAGSALLEGCFGACLCPVRITEPLMGSFRLVELPTLGPGPNRAFRVESFYAASGPQELLISGEGLYQNDPVRRTQRLELRLFVRNEPAQNFDSGLVPVEVGFPAISVRASVHGEQACYDSVLELRAEPLLPPGSPPE